MKRLEYRDDVRMFATFKSILSVLKAFNFSDGPTEVKGVTVIKA